VRDSDLPLLIIYDPVWHPGMLLYAAAGKGDRLAVISASHRASAQFLPSRPTRVGVHVHTYMRIRSVLHDRVFAAASAHRRRVSHFLCPWRSSLTALGSGESSYRD
jgi:hypothetical protein